MKAEMKDRQDESGHAERNTQEWRGCEVRREETESSGEVIN